MQTLPAVQTIPIVDEAKWLAERAKDVTSTEVAALYGLSPYCTHFELWHRKAGTVEVEFEQTERTRWGTRLQDAIAAGVAEDQGWTIKRLAVYMRRSKQRLGSSFDFEVTKAEGRKGPGLMEIKNVDGLVFKNNWFDHGEGNVEAPEHIELQVQHQLLVADREWAALVPLVGGNRALTLLRERDRDIGHDIEKRVGEFWWSIEAMRPPTPDYVADADFMIQRLYNRSNEGQVVTANADIEALVKQWRMADDAEGVCEERKKALKAQILEKIGAASKLLVPGGSFSCGTTKDNPGTLITPEMVGTRVGARSGFRQFRYYAKKGA